MSDERVERRLAAILAADVAGYSRLMGIDEVGTLRALKAIRREFADPAIADHHDGVVKTTGDGFLIEFPSVMDAVSCAVAIQAGGLRIELGRRWTSVYGTTQLPTEVSYALLAFQARQYFADRRVHCLCDAADAQQGWALHRQDYASSGKG